MEILKSVSLWCGLEGVEKMGEDNAQRSLMAASDSSVIRGLMNKSSPYMFLLKRRGGQSSDN